MPLDTLSSQQSTPLHLFSLSLPMIKCRSSRDVTKLAGNGARVMCRPSINEASNCHLPTLIIFEGGGCVCVCYTALFNRMLVSLHARTGLRFNVVLGVLPRAVNSKTQRLTRHWPLYCQPKARATRRSVTRPPSKYPAPHSPCGSRPLYACSLVSQPVDGDLLTRDSYDETPTATVRNVVASPR